MKALLYFWQHQRLALLIAIVALSLAGFFAFNFLAEWVYFNDPMHQNQTLEGWMTMHYVSLSYKLPPPVVAEALQATDYRGQGLRLSEISALTNLSLDDMHALVVAAQSDLRLRQE